MVTRVNNRSSLKSNHAQPRAEMPLVEMPWHKPVAVAVENNRVVAVTGGPGTGKSTYIEHLAAQLTGRPPLVHYASPVDNTDLWGRWVVRGDETCFIDGKIPRSLKENRWLIIEEFSLLPVEERMPLLALRGGARTVSNIMSGEEIDIPDDSWAMLWVGTAENLQCRRNQEAMRALYSSAICVHVPPLDDAMIQRLLRFHFPDAAPELVARVAELFQKYRVVEGHEEGRGKAELNFRAARQLMTLLLDGRLTEHEAVRVCLVNQWILDDDAWTAQELKWSISE